MMQGMQGRIDTSFQTLQRDLFTSGLAAQIGMPAFGVWAAIKCHADYATGECWPGLRRLAELTGLSLGTVSKAVHTLVDARLLRMTHDSPKGRRGGRRYIARERIDVRLGDRVLCTIVMDYVPSRMRERLHRIEQSLSTGEYDAEAFAEVEIIPGPGFSFDPTTGNLRAAIPAHEIPSPPPGLTEQQLQSPLVQRVLSIQERVVSRRRQPVDK